MFLPHPRVKVSIVGSLRDREVACSASDRQGSNFEFCVWRTVSSQSSHHSQEVLLAQFSLYVHKGGLKTDSFHYLTLDPGRAQRCHLGCSEMYHINSGMCPYCVRALPAATSEGLCELPTKNYICYFYFFKFVTAATRLNAHALPLF